MEEDVGIKAPVTRLRRRLSVEQSEDVSSPATPNKKRGGRLAAKPQLDLIDENAQVSSPARNKRKSIARDIVDAAEEKPVTPSRRTTRIKSNTSIVSETATITTDSPRARRAARRNSLAGSDNEAPITPARVRRTRKDSTSSIENQADVAPVSKTDIKVAVIEEESEIDVQKSTDSDTKENTSPGSLRKSPRLMAKKGKPDRKSDDFYYFDNKTEDNKENRKEPAEPSVDNIEIKSSDSNNDKANDSNSSLLKNLDTVSKKSRQKHNKTASNLDIEEKDTNKRNRTKSWPYLTTDDTNDKSISSDNERAKKKKKKTSSNDATDGNQNIVLVVGNTAVLRDDEDSEIIFNRSPQKTYSRQNKQKNNSQSSLLENSKGNISSYNSPNKSKVQEEKENENDQAKSIESDTVTAMKKLFENPADGVKATVYFDDSDSNTGSIGKLNTVDTDKFEGDDQCVPVVEHNLETQDVSPENINIIPKNYETNQSNIETKVQNVFSEPQQTVNDTCEPMDIDETIHEEILHSRSQNNLEESLKEQNISGTPSEATAGTKEMNKSKRKSSLSRSDVKDNSKNENKSTLILSQIKDSSSASVNTSHSLRVPAADFLSKSINNADVIKKEDKQKKNLSLNDLKGTPKQKNLQKLNMQTSTPITQQSEKENKTEPEVNKSKEKNKSNISMNTENSNSSSDEESSKEESVEKSKFIDDEAEEASDDYESGDSRDEDERRYEDEHEIIERGETLDSDDEVSNDTDYEKDSFVVSSNEEDNELLSASGDDLSMSDNELTMSKKSKQKYNDRKLKEQKNASREMFEARHRLDSSSHSAKSPAPKKKNRMRINSSLLDSDEEVVKPKKNNRLRLESTCDSITADNSLNQSKKKNRTKNDSVCNESVTNEKEITIANNSLISKEDDPLLIKCKQEPKTPQKSLDISTVHFTDRHEVEVEMNGDASVLNKTETDPLQVTMAEENSESSSENEEIMQNYDSVLNELNKNTKTNLNNQNVSLNMDKKSKQKKGAPIIDQLNLTGIKKSKKISVSEDVVDGKSSAKSKKDKSIIKSAEEENSSSSIDLQLLFSEDNTESGDESKRKKTEAQPEETIIPLKKTESKTNIREGLDTSKNMEETSALNRSGVKKNKRKSSLVPTEIPEVDENLFFIDTKGEHDKTDVAEESEGAPEEVSYKSDKKKRNKKVSESLNNTVTANSDDVNVSMTALKTPKSEKKKRNKSVSEQEESVTVDKEIKEVPVEVIYENKKDKKTNKSFETSHIELQDTEPTLTPGSQKKKKRKSSQNQDQSVLPVDQISEVVQETEKTPKRDRKASERVQNDIEENELRQILVGLSESSKTPTSQKKKKNKKSQNENEDTLSQSQLAASEITSNVQKTPNSQKKKKNTLNIEEIDTIEKTPKSEKKNKLTESNVNTEELVHNTSVGSAKKQKQKKNASLVIDNTEQIKGQDKSSEETILSNSKKRKRKSSNPTSEQEGVSEDIPDPVQTSEALNESVSMGTNKKKRKISHNDKNDNKKTENTAKVSKKNKKNHLISDLNYVDTEQEPVSTETSKKPTNKKRKERDEDNPPVKKSKILKENSFQEVHEVNVPRLPTNILSRLEDKTLKEPSQKKRKVVSTSQFVVEDTVKRKTKPSNYLEESIYLNDTPNSKKHKSNIKKPKVLPFIPTASTSDSGFTTKFQINVLTKETNFIAVPKDVSTKDALLYGRNIKKLRTYDLYKKQRTNKLSKF